jgi:hypothetical protein
MHQRSGLEFVARSDGQCEVTDLSGWHFVHYRELVKYAFIRTLK